MSTIQVMTTAPVATITMSRPPLNVLDIAMMEALNHELLILRERNDLSVLVIQGEGKCFSAGADINDHTSEKIEPMLKAFHAIFRTLAEWDVLTIASVHGHCLGGGAELAVMCDFVITADNARVGCPEIIVGCFPPIAAVLFPELVGPRKAIDLITSGRIISGQEAAEIGLFTRSVPAAELADATREQTNILTAQSPVVLRLTRKAIGVGRAEFLPAMEKAERIYLEKLTQTQDMIEGVDAFMEKRKPVWTGK